MTKCEAADASDQLDLRSTPSPPARRETRGARQRVNDSRAQTALSNDDRKLCNNVIGCACIVIDAHNLIKRNLIATSPISVSSSNVAFNSLSPSASSLGTLPLSCFWK